MAELLLGKPVADFLNERNLQATAKLNKFKIKPTLVTVRIGENPDDIFYEESIIKNCKKVGVEIEHYRYNESTNQANLEVVLNRLVNNKRYNGIFFFSPIPKHLDEKAARAIIPPERDVDSLTLGNAAKIYTGDKEAFAPCTAAAVMELLKFYNIPLEGKNVVIVGRSLVVGKPLAMLMLDANATVTICHSRTKDLQSICKNADIIVAAVGKAKMIDASYVKEGQVIIDVGINPDPNNEGKICGDVDFDSVKDIVAKITPVPNGVGSVTTAILCQHTILAAINSHS